MTKDYTDNSPRSAATAAVIPQQHTPQATHPNPSHLAKRKVQDLPTVGTEGTCQAVGQIWLHRGRTHPSAIARSHDRGLRAW